MGAKVRKIDGAWVLVVHHEGKRRKRNFGSTGADKRRAEKAAEEINHKLALRQYNVGQEDEPIPFDGYARRWVQREVLLPTQRRSGDHLAPGTARSYELQVRVHLVPFFGDRDLRSIDVPAVQALYDLCIDRGRPRTPRSIEMIIATLGQILAHALGEELVEMNAVALWKEKRRTKSRRRSSAQKLRVSPEVVMSGEELAAVLDTLHRDSSAFYPLFLFLADTGARIGEASALRWADVCLEAGTAHISRSFSSGLTLGPTKAGIARHVELSTRLRILLEERKPDLHPDEALVFPSAAGTMIDPANARRDLARMIRRHVPELRQKRITPHSFRHTFASLHLARGTNLMWIQKQGGWKSPHVLLTTYAHFLPTEVHGHADAITSSATAPDGPMRPWVNRAETPAKLVNSKSVATTPASLARPGGLEPPTCGLEVRCSIQLSYGRAGNNLSASGGNLAPQAFSCRRPISPVRRRADRIHPRQLGHPGPVAPLRCA